MNQHENSFYREHVSTLKGTSVSLSTRAIVALLAPAFTSTEATRKIFRLKKTLKEL
jgi:hypothetical protein